MKKTRTMRKVLLAVFSAMLLVCVTIGATVAYLTSQDTVTNTFTVGKVAITLDEAKTNVDGQPVDANDDIVDLANAPRVEGNAYKLMPGHTYTKDPIIHVASNSEDCYLFVKVENPLNSMEGATTIANQMAENGWKAVQDVTNVYIYAGTAEDSAKQAVSANADIGVFDTFTINGDVTAVTDPGAIVITAYAVQADGFEEENPAGIWTAAFGSNSGN